jgi:Dullard-like phosphatase family protein
MVPKSIETGNQGSSFQNPRAPQPKDEFVARQNFSLGKEHSKPAEDTIFYTVNSPKLLTLNKFDKNSASFPANNFIQMDPPINNSKPLNRASNEVSDPRYSLQPVKSNSINPFNAGGFNPEVGNTKYPAAFQELQGPNHLQQDPQATGQANNLSWNLHPQNDPRFQGQDLSIQPRHLLGTQTPQSLKKATSFKVLPPPPPQYQEATIKKRLPPPPTWLGPELTPQSPKQGRQLAEGKVNKPIYFTPQLSLKRSPKLDIHPDSCYNFLNSRRYKDDPQTHTPLEDFFLKESIGQFKIARTVALHTQQPPNPVPIFLNRKKKHLLVLDIDETLVHSDLIVEQSVELEHMKGKKYDTKINFANPNQTVDVYGVRYRPFLLEFLERMHRVYDIAVYTASTRDYADAVLNELDPRRELFVARLYRENCLPVNGMNIKNMKNFPGNDAVLVDNLIYSYAFQMGQGIPICPFIDDDMDVELKDLAELLENLNLYPDMSVLIDELLGLNEFYSHLEQLSAKTGGYEILSPTIHHAPVSTNERTAHGSLMTSLL